MSFKFQLMIRYNDINKGLAENFMIFRKACYLTNSKFGTTGISA